MHWKDNKKVANLSNDFVANYILMMVCVIIDLVHLLIKPYNKQILNEFDSIILHFINLIAIMSLSDDFDSPLVVTMFFVLVILPL